MNNSLGTIGVKSWKKQPGSSSLTPSRTREQSAGKQSEKRQDRQSERSEYWQNTLRSNDNLNHRSTSRTSRNAKRGGMDLNKHPVTTYNNIKVSDSLSNRSFASRGHEIAPVLKKSVLSNKSDRERSSQGREIKVKRVVTPKAGKETCSTVRVCQTEEHTFIPIKEVENKETPDSKATPEVTTLPNELKEQLDFVKVEPGIVVKDLDLDIVKNPSEQIKQDDDESSNNDPAPIHIQDIGSLDEPTETLNTYQTNTD